MFFDFFTILIIVDYSILNSLHFLEVNKNSFLRFHYLSPMFCRALLILYEYTSFAL